MNPSAVLKSLLKPCAALTAAAGALMMASCYAPQPVMGPPFGPQGGPPQFGYNGTRSPNYPTDPRGVTTKPADTAPKIVRDPNNTVVNVEPPAPRNPPGTNPPPSSGTPAEAPPTSNPEPTKPPVAVKEDLPYGIPVVGKKGMVYSPYAPEKGQVDVDGFKRGTRVECPYTAKHFRVP